MIWHLIPNLKVDRALFRIIYSDFCDYNQNFWSNIIEVETKW